MLWDDCFQHSLLRAPKFIGGVEYGVNEIQDFILGQYIFIMQILDDEAQFIMDVIIIAIIFKTVHRQKCFNFN